MDATAGFLFLIIELATGRSVSADSVIQEAARRDVVFLGEEHDQDHGHTFQLGMLEGLHAQRPDLVVSLEMFERDVQGVVDDYLRGRIDEATFRDKSRPWPNYEKHYKPVIEFAKSRGLDVIAGNVPRAIARKVATQGTKSVRGQAGMPRSTNAPDDRYRALFMDAMKDHGGADDSDAKQRMYASQCLKDDGMAEAIADYLEGRPHRRPLVVHLCGKFHSDYGYGTVQRLLQRRPLTNTAVFTMESFEGKEPTPKELEKLNGRGHWLLVLPPKPKAKESEKTDAAAPVTPKAEGSAPAPAAAPVAKPDAATPPPTGRPALGIMPDYAAASEPGVVIQGVSAGGAAEKAGPLAQDRIILIGEDSVGSLEDYMAALDGRRPGDVINVGFVRGTEKKTVSVTLQVSHRQ